MQNTSHSISSQDINFEEVVQSVIQPIIESDFMQLEENKNLKSSLILVKTLCNNRENEHLIKVFLKTIQQMDNLTNVAYEEGWSKGHDEGFEEGYALGLEQGEVDGYEKFKEKSD